MSQLEGLILVNRQDIELIKRGQQTILEKLDQLQTAGQSGIAGYAPYITALEFMQAVRIRRWKFNNLVRSGKVKAIKKKRKVYVPKAEVERYFREVQE